MRPFLKGAKDDAPLILIDSVIISERADSTRVPVEANDTIPMIGYKDRDGIDNPKSPRTGFRSATRFPVK
jgi:hypothetical protein